MPIQVLSIIYLKFCVRVNFFKVKLTIAFILSVDYNFSNTKIYIQKTITLAVT